MSTASGAANSRIRRSAITAPFSLSRERVDWQRGSVDLTRRAPFGDDCLADLLRVMTGSRPAANLREEGALVLLWSVDSATARSGAWDGRRGRWE